MYDETGTEQGGQEEQGNSHVLGVWGEDKAYSRKAKPATEEKMAWVSPARLRPGSDWEDLT